MGIKIGLYTCIGTQTCKNNLPGSFGHYDIDAKTFVSWGIDYVKADNCNKPSDFTEQQLFSNFSFYLNKTSVEAGHPLWFSLCEWGVSDVISWGGTVANMYRIQQDHLPLWDCGAPICQGPTGWGGPGFGQGTKQIIEYVATLPQELWSGPNTATQGFGDPDFLMTMYPVTFDVTKSQSEFSFWALWSAPLIVATDMANMTSEKRQILANTAVIAVDQDPLGKPGYRLFNNSDGTQMWLKNCADGSLVVLLYNGDEFSQQVVNVSPSWRSVLGTTTLPLNVTSMNGTDLWEASRSMGLDPSKPYSIALQPTQVQMLRLSW